MSNYDKVMKTLDSLDVNPVKEDLNIEDDFENNEPNDSEITYEFIDSKSVPDSDGFLTDYTWYKTSDGRHVFVFGDSDIYRPEDEDFDWECQSDEEAREWFEDYTGFDEE